MTFTFNYIVRPVANLGNSFRRKNQITDLAATSWNVQTQFER
jgi:hypothetical protein